jgi:hypothetical protein
MLNCTIALRRLFTKPPTEGELRYAWWYVRFGRVRWVEDLRHFSERDRNRVLHHVDRRMAKRLETWDTLNYRTWKAGEELPKNFYSIHPMPLERK